MSQPTIVLLPSQVVDIVRDLRDVKTNEPSELTQPEVVEVRDVRHDDDPGSVVSSRLERGRADVSSDFSTKLQGIWESGEQLLDDHVKTCDRCRTGRTPCGRGRDLLERYGTDEAKAWRRRLEPKR